MYMYDCQTDTEEELVIEFCYVVTTFTTMYTQQLSGHVNEARNTKDML